MEDVFTTDPSETCIHVTQWGYLGETWPFFKPNFVNMENCQAATDVDEVSCLSICTSQPCIVVCMRCNSSSQCLSISSSCL